MEPEHENNTNNALGYVVVKDLENYGYIGGYLCVDERGVPIEFCHTTESPVKTTRIQKLLYGKKLEPELLGRHITKSLVQLDKEKRKTPPSVLFTKNPAIFEGFDVSDIVIVLIQTKESQSISMSNCSSEKISTNSGQTVTLVWKNENNTQVEPLISLVKKVDLLEPFDRIDALLEELKDKPSE